MFPLYDENRAAIRPFVTWLLIALNVALFAWELAETRGFTDERAYLRLLAAYGLTPARLADALATGNYAALVTLFTSMFLHANFQHIFGNLLFLYIFGDNVEEAFGHLRYLLLYLLFGLAGSLAHSAVALTEAGVAALLPAVGASGAISGVLGAYVVFFPHARVVTVAFFFFLRILRIPAFLYLGFWFFLQLLYGATGSGGSVAFLAHVGGFVAGAVAAVLLRLSGYRPRVRR